MKKIILVAALCAIPAPAMAETGGEAPKERMICKRDVVSASRVQGKKRCYTAAQWKDRGVRTAQDMDKLNHLHQETNTPTPGL